MNKIQSPFILLFIYKIIITFLRISFFALFFVFFIIGNKKIRLKYFKNEIKDEYLNIETNLKDKENNKKEIINKKENLQKAENLENVLIISSNNNPPKKLKTKPIVKSCLTKDNKNKNKKLKLKSFKNEINEKTKSSVRIITNAVLTGKTKFKKHKKRKKKLNQVNNN